MERALEIAQNSQDDWDFLRWLETKIGNSVLTAESVPLAFYLMLKTMLENAFNRQNLSATTAIPLPQWQVLFLECSLVMIPFLTSVTCQ